MAVKNGDCLIYNEAENQIKYYIRGRPVVMYPPTQLASSYKPHQPSSPPSKQLQLQWAYGYRGKDCRNNLHTLQTGELVYFVAGTVVIYNPVQHSQRHYMHHTDDVTSLAVHPDGEIVASGQCAGTNANSQPQVHVWNSHELKPLHVLGVGFLERSVSCLAFSQSDGGCRLACVDTGRDLVLSVWLWKEEKRLLDSKASCDSVTGVKWHPTDNDLLMTCGRQQLTFWTLGSSEQKSTRGADGGVKIVKRRQGVFGSWKRPKFVTAMLFTQEGDLLTGDSESQLLVWKYGETKASSSLNQLHSGAIFSLTQLSTGTILSAGKDCRIIEWHSSLKPTGKSIQCSSDWGSIRAITETLQPNSLFIGTTRNAIIRCNWQQQEQEQQDQPGKDIGDLVTWGHTDEVWGLACHPRGVRHAHGAWDGQLYMSDSQQRRIVWHRDMQAAIQSLCFSIEGCKLAVGMTTGHWYVLDSESGAPLFSSNPASEAIQAIRFSPDDTQVALGSRNNTCYIYKVDGNSDEYILRGKCTGHSSFITHVDWSSDSSTIRTNSGDYELLHWDAGSCQLICQPSKYRDMQWATHTCTLTFNTFGVFPEGADGTDVNTCWADESCGLIASGDDFGKVNLYRYPANQAQAQHRVYGGHSSHVTHVEINSQGSDLVTAGGNDTAILQWTISH